MMMKKQLKSKSIETLEKTLSLWQSKRGFSLGNMKRKESDPSTVSFLGRKISRKLIVPNSLEDITITSQRLCEEYMEARLARSGMKEFDNTRDEQDEEYSNVLRNMGQILEMKYPRLYTKISSHLKMSYDSEIVVWDSFNKFGTHLFADGITWGKIIAFYAFTGGLALDCMSHGRSYLLAKIVYWFGVFVMKKLAAWIQNEGGWKSIINHFNTNLGGYDSEDDEDYNDSYRSRMTNYMRTIDKQQLVITIAALMFLLYLFYYFRYPVISLVNKRFIFK